MSGYAELIHYGIQHVNYVRAPENHVYELRWKGKWYRRDLTLAANAPNAWIPPYWPYAEFPTRGYVSHGDGTVHFNFLGEDLHVHELWSPRGGHTWRHNDLFLAACAPAGVRPYSIDCGYVHPDGTHHVICSGGRDLHVHELWWDGTWHYNDLTVAAGAPAPLYPGYGYVNPADGTQHIPCVTYVQGDGQHGHVFELWWDGAWHCNDLTLAANAPSKANAGPGAVPGSGANGYMHPDGTQHIHFVGAHDYHVHELWWDGTWHYNDLTLAANVPHSADAQGRSVIAFGRVCGYVHPDGTQHVPYQSSDWSVNELWYDGNWHYNNLSAATGAPDTVHYVEPVSGYVNPGDNTQHVMYWGKDGHLHELWWDGWWHHNDLTVAAGA